MTEPLWSPSAERVAAAAMTQFQQEAARRLDRPLPDYWSLHRWSVEEAAEFWRSYADYARLPLRGPPTSIISDDPMPFTKWFEGALLNYAEALLQPPEEEHAAEVALIALNEAGGERRLGYGELRREVARCRAALQRCGVTRGDRVAAYISNVPESVILLLACSALGAIFSSCSPDFGFDAAYARFGQIKPKLLVASDGYSYNGRYFVTRETIQKLAGALQPRPQVVVVPFDRQLQATEFPAWEEWLEPDAPLSYTQLPFDHPLYVLYSSGTTGPPKAMVHRAGGVLLAHHREHRLHGDIGPGDVVLYFTTCGWMMWNWLVSVLAQGATIVLYDGSPAYPDMEVLWRTLESKKVTHFGTSASYLHACKAEGLEPSRHGLHALKTLFSTGSPLSPGGFHWVYEAVKGDLHLASISGGTDIVSCFMGGVPTLPVYAGEVQAPSLGVDLAAFDDDGTPVLAKPAELVCRRPLPSMPLEFVNDLDHKKYRDAYFSVFPGVWRHGDLIEITERGGIIVYGRSDATLNPGGVRIGTAEIYRPLEAVAEVVDAMAVGKRLQDDEVIWLFVVLDAGQSLTAELEAEIRSEIRRQSSPRHVPRRIFQVSQLPRTRSGKATEIAVSRLVNGREVPNRAVMANPEALDEISRVIL